MNVVVLSGNVGKMPEVRYTKAGKAVCNFTLATSKRWKDKDGTPQSKTTWHQIVAWDKLGEICGEYISKGDKVLVHGEIDNEEYTAKDGSKRTASKVVISTWENLSPRKKAEAQADNGQDDAHDEEDADTIPF